MRVKTCSIIMLLAITFLVPLVHAQSYDDKSTLNTVVTISNTFDVLPTSNDYNIRSINASVSAYPKNDTRQIVSQILTNPQAMIADNAITFFYDNPLSQHYTIQIKSDVNTRNIFDEVKVPVKFPITALDGSFYKYTQATPIIDVTPEIRDLASELVGDNKDIYEIEYAFAEYVRKNVNYDLGSLTSNADQKSSWVLQNKRGVCDEITNLFISLNRAAGIPARFVSGVAYTNLNDIFGKNWVSHAWAEVYFPGYGWVPYDVTYGQYGFIDAGHIKLLDSVESSSSNINYNYYGRNIQLKPGSMDTDVNILDFGENVKSKYSFQTTLFSEQAGFGSYDLVKVEVKNNKDYYIVADLYLGETENVKIIENSVERVLNKTLHRKEVLLKPYQVKTVYWLVKIDDSLDKNYIYTFPITVYNTYNETSTANLDSRKDYVLLDADYLNKLLASQDAESRKPYSRYITVQCIPEVSNMYLEDTVTVGCVIDNKGDKSFSSINICVDGNCTTQNLAIQKISTTFTKKFSDVGLKNIEVKVYNDDFIKVSYVPINVQDKPKILISDVKIPESVLYNEQFDIVFKISKESSSTPKNLRLSLIGPVSKVEWLFEGFDTQKIFSIKSSGSAMGPGTNNYKIIVQYKDDKGKDYIEEYPFQIESDAGFFENILLYFNVIGHSIEKVFIK